MNIPEIETGNPSILENDSNCANIYSWVIRNFTGSSRRWPAAVLTSLYEWSASTGQRSYWRILKIVSLIFRWIADTMVPLIFHVYSSRRIM